MRCQITCKTVKRKALQAITLAEVMISVFVLALVFVGFYVNLKQGFASVEQSRENLGATQVLNQTMEGIRLYTWGELNSNGFMLTNFTISMNPDTNGLSKEHYTSSNQVYTCTVTISPSGMSESYATNLELVTATVTWVSDVNHITNSRSMSTYYSIYGLHNYFE